MHKNICVMKHFLITIVLAVFTAIQVHAKEAIVDGLRYSLFEDTHEAMVDFGNKWVGELTIPSEISVNGQTYTVSKIAWKAFSFCVTLTRVTIPKTVREIWNDLNEKDLNTSFIGCLNLEAIEVEEGNSSFCSVDGVLFNADTTSLYAYPAGKKEEHYVVPASVTSIARSAFMLSQSLVTVQIPKGVTCVGYEAFSNSERLEEVYLPSGITELSGNLFNYCKNLKHVNIPLGVTNIATCAFYGCTSLRVLDIPKSVTSLGSSTFKECRFDALVIRGSLEWKNIPEDVFNGMDASSVIYVQPSEIEKFKKVYQGTVLPLTDYVPSGLSSVTGQSSVSQNHDILFDLQGRRLKTEPKHGVYIKGGKLRVK